MRQGRQRTRPSSTSRCNAQSEPPPRITRGCDSNPQRRGYRFLVDKQRSNVRIVAGMPTPSSWTVTITWSPARLNRHTPFCLRPLQYVQTQLVDSGFKCLDVAMRSRDKRHHGAGDIRRVPDRYLLHGHFPIKLLLCSKSTISGLTSLLEMISTRSRTCHRWSRASDLDSGRRESGSNEAVCQ